jgi:hypothetical protein
MKAAIRFVLLVLALTGFLVFLSFDIVKIGPVESVTVGQNISPWLKWSRVRGVAKFTEEWKINVLSWSALGLPVGLGFLFLRSCVKG